MTKMALTLKKFALFRKEFFGVMLIDPFERVFILKPEYLEQLESGNITDEFRNYLISRNCLDGELATDTVINVSDFELKNIAVSENDITLSSPLKVEFEITNKCNLNCVHCAVSAKECRRDNELTTDEVKSILRQIKEQNIVGITITGGEPLTRPDIYEILDYSNELGIFVGLLTNGLLLNEENLKRIPRNVYLQISLDGLGEVYDRIRGEGNFVKIEKVIALLKEHKFNFTACFTFTNENKASLNETMEYCLQNDIRLLIHTLLPFGRAYENLATIDPELEADAELLYEARKRKIQHIKAQNRQKYSTGHQLNIYDFFEIFEKCFLACDAARSDMWITSDGIAYPCPNLAALKQFPLGSVREETLAELWNNQKADDFRRTYTWESFTDCKDCDIADYCNQRCMAISYSLHGEHTKCGCSMLLKTAFKKAIAENFTDRMIDQC